jgi:hypothetical protein
LHPQFEIHNLLHKIIQTTKNELPHLFDDNHLKVIKHNHRFKNEIEFE